MATQPCVCGYTFMSESSCSRKGLAIQTSSMTVIGLSAFTQKSGSVTERMSYEEAGPLLVRP